MDSLMGSTGFGSDLEGLALKRDRYCFASRLVAAELRRLRKNSFKKKMVTIESFFCSPQHLPYRVASLWRDALNLRGLGKCWRTRRFAEHRVAIVPSAQCRNHGSEQHSATSACGLAPL